MISIALCDDEQIFLSHYEKRIIELANNLDILYEIIKFDSGESLLFFLEDYPNKFDIIYLDIMMKQINGIDTALKIKKLNADINIVFLTSNEGFVYDSFAAAPVNYLLKQKDHKKFDSVFKSLIAKIDANANKDSFIYESRTQKIHIPFHRIVYFEIFKRIVIIRLIDGESVEFYGNLNSLESKLKSHFFIRTHRSYLVNMQYISKLKNQEVILKSEETLPVSRLYGHQVKDALSSYLFGVNINE